MAAVIQYRPHQPKPQQNTLAAFLLAVMMHGVLVGALWLNIQWNVEPAGEVVAELWGTVAPPVEVPPPPPKIEPAPAPPPKPIEPPQKSQADIALEEEKKRRELERIGQEKLRQAQIERLEKERLEKEKREQELLKQAQLEKERLERERVEKAERERAEKERLEKERVAKARAEQERREKEERERLEAKRQEERREALRKAELARMQSGVGAVGGNPNASATTGGGGRGDDYGAQLAALIRPKIVFAVPENTSASVYAEYRIELLPTGEIQSVRLLRPSGLPGYDAAVERAIRRTDPFPRKRDGSLPDRTLVIRFRPVDTQ